MYNSGILDYYLMWIINVEMYMDKLHFIVNPVAGGTSAIDKFGAVKGMLDDMRFPYTYEFTQCKGHGRELARAAAEHGEKYIIAVGGRRHGERSGVRPCGYRYGDGHTALRHGE